VTAIRLGGIDEDLEAVGDGRPGKIQRLGQVADECLAAFVRGDHRDRSQPGGIGQGLEQPGEVGGLVGGDRPAGRSARELGSDAV
jgi:hypothetical protein